MNYAIIIVALILLAIIFYHFFGKDYEFTKEEQRELDLLDKMRAANKSDLLLGNITSEEFVKNNNDLIKMLDDIEKRNRKINILKKRIARSFK